MEKELERPHSNTVKKPIKRRMKNEEGGQK
jgi:hypothetical protein